MSLCVDCCLSLCVARCLLFGCRCLLFGVPRCGLRDAGCVLFGCAVFEVCCYGMLFDVCD